MFYGDWLPGIQEGYVCTRNPFNAAQVRRISLLPAHIDGVVFWTKDPLPVLDGLDLLNRAKCPYYIQFTLPLWPGPRTRPAGQKRNRICL